MVGTKMEIFGNFSKTPMLSMRLVYKRYGLPTFLRCPD
jgi:hypothetical protein